MHSFGRYIREKRVAAGLSLRDVADRIGCSHTFLGEVERGVRSPMNRRWWSKLAQAIDGVTEAELEAWSSKERAIQLHLEDAPPRYRRLGLALARRIEARDITSQEMRRLMELLRGEDDD